MLRSVIHPFEPVLTPGLGAASAAVCGFMTPWVQRVLHLSVLSLEFHWRTAFNEKKPCNSASIYWMPHSRLCTNPVQQSMSIRLRVNDWCPCMLCVCAPTYTHPAWDPPLWAQKSQKTRALFSEGPFVSWRVWPYLHRTENQWHTGLAPKDIVEVSATPFKNSGATKRDDSTEACLLCILLGSFQESLGSLRGATRQPAGALKTDSWGMWMAASLSLFLFGLF